MANSNAFEKMSGKVISYVRDKGRLLEILELDHMNKRMYVTQVNNKYLFDYFETDKNQCMRKAKQYIDDILSPPTQGL